MEILYIVAPLLAVMLTQAVLEAMWPKEEEEVEAPNHKPRQKRERESFLADTQEAPEPLALVKRERERQDERPRREPEVHDEHPAFELPPEFDIDEFRASRD